MEVLHLHRKPRQKQSRSSTPLPSTKDGGQMQNTNYFWKVSTFTAKTGRRLKTMLALAPVLRPVLMLRKCFLSYKATVNFPLPRKHLQTGNEKNQTYRLRSRNAQLLFSESRKIQIGCKQGRDCSLRPNSIQVKSPLSRFQKSLKTRRQMKQSQRRMLRWTNRR